MKSVVLSISWSEFFRFKISGQNNKGALQLSIYGIGIFVKKEIDVLEEGEIWIYNVSKFMVFGMVKVKQTHQNVSPNPSV